MGTAEFSMTITMKGNAEEMRAMLSEIKRYSGRETPAYFCMKSIDIGGEKVNPEQIDDAGLESVQNELVISADGPYGQYFELNDVDIFRDMAKAAPNANFEAHIEGCTSYTEQTLDCELKDGKLHISTFFLSNEEGPEAYIEYYLDKLPFEDFAEMFKVDTTDFDEDSYREFIDCCVVYSDEGLNDLDYEEFCSEMEDCVGVDEEEYEAALAKYSQLGIMSFEEFEENSEYGDRFEYEYDPAVGEYTGSAKSIPVEKPAFADDTIDINEYIRGYLKDNGFPCDDAAIAALSVEDAYAILAGTYGKESAESAQDEPAAESAPAENEPVAESAHTEDEPVAEPAPAENEPVDSQPKKRSTAWVAWLVAAAVAAVIAAAVVFCPFVSELADTALSTVISLFD